MPQLFLNEKSCDSDGGTEDVNRAMSELVKAVLTVAREDRPGTVLVAREPVNGLQLAKGHPIGKWSGLARNKELWQRLLLMQTKWPHEAVYPEGEGYYEVEYRHEGVPVEGLGAAHLMEGMGVSLPVAPHWDRPRLTLVREELVDGDDGPGSAFTEVKIPHASTREHVDEHLPWIRECAEATRRGDLSAVRTGADLWDGRAALFPHLQFLPQAEADFRGLPEGWVRPVRERLEELELAVSGWDPETRPIAPLWRSDVRTEFEMRRKLCKFIDLDGVERIFDWHCEFLPKPGRMHFRLVHEERTLRIAYVGRKRGV
ncbi:hypothetical protein GCM10010371_16690 [Streptomyces subrutilus]|uniref:Uncharacterized protein n=1 Tax=Streptomyces subrutilus TaxID=36818 RepID=A0A5P2UK86_9ACTN|nr:hypothetical protein [Streptomyces subrutilus]QEU78765.1 hypothetical protein CP968_11070 [Streptomyces subrutilus]GGZ57875.1 hypothetical protein GCM10010371_16690 [Streptomyces subrutilus]